MSSIARTRPRLVAAAVAATWIAIGIGAFQKLYVTVHFINREAWRRQWVEAPYRNIPGLRQLLHETEARTKVGDRVLLWTPHRPWQGGYGYAFRRAQYVLAGRDVLPVMDRGRDVEDYRYLPVADYVTCWPECPPFPGFELVWRGEKNGMLVRRR